MAAVIEANGGDLRSAQPVMAASKRRSPLVREVVLEHISMLTAVAPGQLVRYRNQVRDHLSGPIGVTPVDSLDIRVIISWIQEMQGKGLSAKTIENVHGLLSAALKTATVLGYREDNPCRGVPLPKSTATDDDMRLLTHVEARLIIDEIPDQYRLLIRFLLATGMRWGEATALRVSGLDLDGETGSVRIRSSAAPEAASPPRQGSRVQAQSFEIGDLGIRLGLVGVPINRVGRHGRELEDRPDIDRAEHDLGVAEPKVRYLPRPGLVPQPPFRRADHLGHLLRGEGSQLCDDPIICC